MVAFLTMLKSDATHNYQSMLQPFSVGDLLLPVTLIGLRQKNFERFHMSDPLATAAQEWFKKGNEAMGRQNWDFAVECFSNAVKMKPDALLFRQTRHLSCRKLHGDNGTGAKMAGMKLMGVRGKIKKARGKKMK